MAATRRGRSVDYASVRDRQWLDSYQVWMNSLTVACIDVTVQFLKKFSLLTFGRDICCLFRWDKVTTGQMAKCFLAGLDLTTHTVGSQISRKTERRHQAWTSVTMTMMTYQWVPCAFNVQIVYCFFLLVVVDFWRLLKKKNLNTLALKGSGRMSGFFLAFLCTAVKMSWITEPASVSKHSYELSVRDH